MFEGMLGYYRKSAVMHEIMRSIEQEFGRLKAQTELTENQFFVVLSDRDMGRHEQDVGLLPDTEADIDTRRGRVLSKLRGTGTVTKAMMKNAAASFVNGDIEIIEYPAQYCFAVKFTSRTGIPYNLEDIKAMIEMIKPAHLAVEYIFTYRLWQDVRELLEQWEAVRSFTWEQLLSFENPQNIMISESRLVYFSTDNTGNGFIVWDGNRAYARRIENGTD